jgi:hypothetical protein
MAWFISKKMQQDFANSHSSQEPAEASSQENSSAGSASVPSNTNPMQETSCSKGKKKASSNPSPSGTTYEPLTDGLGAAWLTWYLAGSPAQTSLRPEQMDWVSQVEKKADFGEKWQGLSVKFDRDTSSWRTLPSYEAVDLTSFSKTLPRWGMMLRGALFQRKTSALPISVKECGLWRPPQATEGDRGQHADPFLLVAHHEKGRQVHLSDQVKSPWLWRTVIADTEAGFRSTTAPSFMRRIRDKKPYHLETEVLNPFLWPTITVCGNNNYKGASKTSGDGIETAIQKQMLAGLPQPHSPLWCEAFDDKPAMQSSDECTLFDRATGKPSPLGVTKQVLLYERSLLSYHTHDDGRTLPYFRGRMNPDWAEWLMGWPVGWTKSHPLDEKENKRWGSIDWWAAEPPTVPRILEKSQDRMRRIRCIGNGQVPVCAAFAFLILFNDLTSVTPS